VCVCVCVYIYMIHLSTTGIFIDSEIDQHFVMMQFLAWFPMI